MKSAKIGLVALAFASVISVVGAKELYVDKLSKASIIYEMRETGRSVVSTGHSARDVGIVNETRLGAGLNSPERPTDLAN
ncbi:hypothetical protein [Methylocella tundrae]|uniref:Uncharacterized protein n=1 Tax=Methylocella tundrae TaxID=227605 RepID=A0A4U8Z4K2_METTU|nr:hypothetical protein [Methylocella tundrae]WPP04161.1 hypothetical protein SIN04_17150 [Methylocella tundrae]VFU10432.1 protein of unknown function [Methylocella tundrae]